MTSALLEAPLELPLPVETPRPEPHATAAMSGAAGASLPAGASPPGLLAGAADPELLALPAPPKRERTATVALMIMTALAATWMAFSLRSEAFYALRSSQPDDLGDLSSMHPAGDLANHYVRGSGLLGTTGAIRYGRAAEGDSFRLAPVAGASNVWVEIRVPEGFEGPRFVPPTSYAGRLVPFKDAGIRHVGLAASIKEQTGVDVPADAWLLVDGSSPRASRWALALLVLFVGFAAWNLAGVARVLGRVRDEGDGEGPSPDAPEPA